MNLFIDITAADKSLAAVTSLTNSTPVSQLEQLVLGDSAPLVIKFTDGSAAPSWAGAAGYTLRVGLGIQDTAAVSNKATAESFVAITAGWSGRINLGAQDFIDAMTAEIGSAVNFSAFNRFPRGRQNSAWFVLQVEVVDPSGNVVTYAVLRVSVANRVLGPSAGTEDSTESLIYAWARANTVLNASFSGIASNVEAASKLCGLTTANGAYPVGAKILVAFPSEVQALFELVAITTSDANFLFAPWDYNVTSNAYKWRLRGVWTYGVPCLWNDDTAKWHSLVAVGAAGAVTTGPDQTGLSLPA